MSGDAAPAAPPVEVAAGMRLDAAVLALRRAFAAAGLETPDLDARLIARGLLDLDLTGLIRAADRPLTASEAAALAELAGRRIAGVPVARLFGEQEFWGLPFRLGPDTLVPRPDTETLVAVALDLLRRSGTPAPVVADLGTGSGAVLAAILTDCPGAFGIGTDLAAGALAVAAGNLAALGLAGRAALVRGSFADALAPCRFDLIVSNPPYIVRAVIAGLAPEVRLHDPLLALDGGEDGLDAYRALVARSAAALVPGAALAVEIGYDQGRSVPDLFARAGLTRITVVADAGGNDRVVVGFAA